MDELILLLGQIPVGGVGFGAIVTLGIVGILRGDIVPKRTLDSLMLAKDDEIKTLKTAYDLSEQARRIVTDANNQELLELGRTTVQLLDSFHERAYGAEAK